LPRSVLPLAERGFPFYLKAYGVRAMNRQQRRAAVKDARKQNRGAARVVAVHEAGHALGRYLTADVLGFQPEEAIAYIEVLFDPRPRASLDGKATVSSSAVTFGRMYSRHMDEFLKANPVPQDAGRGHPITIDAEVKACRTGGVDVESWAGCKAFICMAGPAAEARFAGRPASDVVKSYECESDLRDAVRECMRAGKTAEEAQEVAKRALDKAEAVLAEPGHWRAVLALAESLPVAGRMQGRRAAAIIKQALEAKL
jgi:hypothetical protein